MTTSSPQTVLCFSDHAVVGKVYLSQNENPAWRPYTLAQGKVEVEPGAKVRLDLNEEFFLHYPTLNDCPAKEIHYLSVGQSKAEEEQLGGLDLYQSLEKLSLRGMHLSKETFEVLGKLPELKALDLSECFLEDDIFLLLGRMTGLQSLILSNSSVIDQQVMELKGLANLKVLHLNKTVVGDDGLMMLEGLSELKELRLGHRVSDLGLSRLRFCPGLVSLDVAETHCTDNGMIKVGELEELRSLSLPEQLSSQGFHNLAGLEKLESLIIGSRYLIESDFIALSRFTSLKTIITEAMFEPAAFEHFQPGTKLKRLFLTAQTIRPELVAQLTKLPNLENLSLASKTISNNDLWCFEGLNSIKRLHFHLSSLTTGGLKWLRDTYPQWEVTHSPIKALYLNHLVSGTLLERSSGNEWHPCSKTPTGAIIWLDKEYSFRTSGDFANSLDWLGENPSINLVEAKITGCILNKDDVKNLSKFNELRSLELTQCQLPDLLDHQFPKRFPLIQKLSLSYSKVPMSWFELLSNFEKLESLELIATGFRDEDLFRLESCSSLKEVDVRHTKVTDTALATFREKCPAIMLHGGGRNTDQ